MPARAKILQLPSPVNRAVKPLMPEQTEWLKLPAAKRDTALAREQLIQPVLRLMETGVSQSNAVAVLVAEMNATLLPDALMRVARQLGKGDKNPSASIIKKWIKRFKDDGRMGLVDQHTGRVRKDYGWESRAIDLWCQMTAPEALAVAGKLRREGFAEATDSRVGRFLKTYKTQNRKATDKARLGPHNYRLNMAGYQFRNTNDVPVGLIYQGDGHNLDWYTAHPNGGGLWRPEFTAWIDVRSRYIVGWYISNAESALNTLFSLSHAITAHDHVPAALHIDNGSGFFNEMMTDKTTGFYNRLNMQVIAAIPGNPRGKGHIERFFRELERNVGVFFDSYIGGDTSKELNRRISAEHKQGKRQLPTLDQTVAAIREWLDQYHNEPHGNLDGRTPAEVWAELEHTPLHMEADALIRPQKRAVVTRNYVSLFKRQYQDDALLEHRKDEVIVEYDLHNDESVRITTLDGRWICDAPLVKASPYLSHSFIEDAQQKRLKGQHKRLQDKANEVSRRARGNITHEDQMDALGLNDEALESSPAKRVEPQPSFILDDEDEPQQPNPTPIEIDYYGLDD